MTELEREFTDARRKARAARYWAQVARNDGNRELASSYARAAEWWEAQAKELGERIDGPAGE
jgi:propanediol dehydratase small subunit